jgi:hypothetical protein
MNFLKNKYTVVKKAIPYELADFVFNYFLLKREAVNFLYSNNLIQENSMLGTWRDKQVPNVYSHYSDFVMETLLSRLLSTVKKKTNLNLIPTYSYARIYEKGSILARHKDRPSCEISTTLNLGGDPWPIFIDPTGSDNVIDEYRNIMKPNAPKGVKINLNPGDMLIYSGCQLEHWREKFKGKVCAQVFLHYNNQEGPFKKSNLFDGRPVLGIPLGIPQSL